MTALLEFQRTLARAVMAPLSSRDNMKRAVKRGTDSGAAEDGAALVKPNSRLSSFERLEIYSRSYWSRILDAFADDFPGVRAVLGTERFDRLRRSYLADCPSQSFTMRDLGKHLAAWMERNPQLAGEHLQVALDMARLEWAEIESFDAAEHARLSPAEVAALSPDCTLLLQPHLRWIEVGYEVDRLVLEARESLSRNKMPRKIVDKRIAGAKCAAPLYIAVHRFELVVHYKRLDGEMFRLLGALAAGATIAEAVETAYAESKLAPEQCAQQIQQSFALFASLGWFHNSSQQSEERI
jgi:hypothetical protein